MPWARLDDGLIDHPKFNELMMEPDGWAAFGFWAAMLIWANKQTRRPGKTPGLLRLADVAAMDRANAGRYAGLLVKVGFWELHGDGWLIHDFSDFLPSERKLAAQRANAAKGGKAKAANARRLASGQDDVASGQDSVASGVPSSAQRGQPNPAHALGTGKVVEEVQVVDAPVSSPSDAPPKNVGDVVAAYVSGARSVGQPDPPASLKARVGKQARTLVSEGYSVETLVASAYEMGKGEWNDLAVQVRKDAAGSNGSIGTTGRRVTMAVEAGRRAQERDERRALE